MSETVPTRRMTLDEVKDGVDWSTAEQRVLEECGSGEAIWLPGRRRPEKARDDNRVRAALIRFLMLGGDEDQRPHAKGVMIAQAVVTGVLDLSSCRTQLDLTLSDCRIEECPDLMDARLGALFLPGCALPKGLMAQRLSTDGSVHLSKGFEADDAVDLLGARIGGQLSCNGGRFHNPRAAKDREACALNLDAARIGADVFLCDGFSAKGEVRLVGAEIGGQLACNGGRFHHPRAAEDRAAVALNLAAARIGADVFLRDGFSAEGEVRLLRAEIGGQLDCSGGRFHHPRAAKDREARALDCEAARIGADVFLLDGEKADRTAAPCVVEGQLDFVRADIAGSLGIEGALVSGPCDFEGMKVGGGFFWRGITWKAPPGASRSVSLTEAHVGALRDDVGSWEGVEDLRLTGFRYDRIDSEITPQQRLEWLARQPAQAITNARRKGTAALCVPLLGRHSDFGAFAHTHLAQVLRRSGDRSGAARIAFDREKRIRAAQFARARAATDGTWGPYLALWVAHIEYLFHQLFRFTFGYGHRPARALWWVVVPILLTYLLAAQTYNHGQMAPNSAVILASAEWEAAMRNTRACAEKKTPQCLTPAEIWAKGIPNDDPTLAVPPAGAAVDWETFSPGLYALDLYTPVLDIGQVAAWAPSKDRGGWGQALYWTRWIAQAIGWAILLVGAAVVTGMVARREEE